MSSIAAKLNIAERFRFDVATRTNAEAQFNAPPHQSELN
jgi:hypothetical protein